MAPSNAYDPAIVSLGTVDHKEFLEWNPEFKIKKRSGHIDMHHPHRYSKWSGESEVPWEKIIVGLIHAFVYGLIFIYCKFFYRREGMINDFNPRPPDWFPFKWSITK